MQAIRSIQDQLHVKRKMVFVELDMRNASNIVRRDNILGECARSTQYLLRLAVATYAKLTDLIFDSHVITS